MTDCRLGAHLNLPLDLAELLSDDNQNIPEIRTLIILIKMEILIIGQNHSYIASGRGFNKSN